MARQRPPDLVPAFLGSADELPLVDDAADVAMAVLTIHHWTDVERGVRELVRVARQRVVIVTIDVPVEAEMWLLRDYVPEIAERDLVEFPTIDAVCGWLGGASVEVLPVPSDCHDGFLLSFWSQPERVLDASSRAATSGFARLADDVVTRAVDSLAADLGDGTWCRRHGDLRQLTEYDAGLRLVVADFAF